MRAAAPVLCALGLCALVPFTASAQDRANTILVLDGSGSMWGQIDGTAKITIAQDVVRDLLGTIPQTQELGLTVYGHRARGDCTDIETIVAPGAGSRAAIADAVGGIKPLGKTPMTDAVIAAANALRFTEEKATVVLVSDGVETCNPDPCAAARALEEAGIDFTAHVVGFDVGSDPEALAQMQCIASETGGQFLTAENATELSTALVAVAAEPAPPAPITITFRGRAGPDGPVITDPLVWSIAGQDGQIATNEQAPSLAFEIAPGDYRVAALWPQYEEIVELTVRVAQDSVVDVVFPAPPPPPVEVMFRAIEGANGPQIDDPLEWAFYQGGAQLGDTLTGATITGALPRGAYRVVVTRPVDGASAEETFGVGSVNSTVTLILPEYLPAATLDAPQEVVAGSTFDVIWTGPDENLDYIATAQLDARPGASETYTYTREGPLLKVVAPAAPGDYHLQYVLRDGSKVLAQQPLRVLPVAATLAAPATGIAGETLTVTWDGPDYNLDYIAVSKRGAPDGQYENYTYTREGTPLGLTMPTTPGEYEIRYTLRQDGRVIARVPVTVTAVGASLSAPDNAVAGDSVTVTWEGPDYNLDFIAVSKAGDPDGRYENYTYTRDGTPLEVVMPTEPGEYELRYTLRQDSEVIARRAITVTGVEASLSAPDSVVAGAPVPVDWQGPDYNLDFIALSKVGDADGRYETYTYTREGAGLTVEAPMVPGTYELRYVLRQDSTVIARQTIEVTPVTASLNAPATAPAGGPLMVTWDGPGYQSDRVAVAAPGAQTGRMINYAYTRKGRDLALTMPAAPGDYELQYLAYGKPLTVLHRQPITVTPVVATIAAPVGAKPGDYVQLEWEGPGYPLDQIELAEGNGGKVIRRVRPRGVSPIELQMPDAPGTYELRYVMNEERTVLTTVPLVIAE